MSRILADYLDQERGRAARVAEAVGISRSYLSDVAKGKKTPSVKVMRDIAQETGLPLSQLLGDQGFSEGAVEPYVAGPQSAGILDLARAIAPDAKRPEIFVCVNPNRDMAVRAGDILVIDLSFDQDQLPAGQDVVCQIVDENGEASTLLAMVATPWLVGAGSTFLGRIGNTGSVVGVIKGLLRGRGAQ